MALLRKYITGTVFDGYDAVTEIEFGGYSIKRIPPRFTYRVNVERRKRRMTPTKRRDSKPIESRLMTLEIGQHRRHLFYVNTRISHYTRKHIRVERNTRGGPRSSSQTEKPTNLVKSH